MYMVQGLAHRSGTSKGQRTQSSARLGWTRRGGYVQGQTSKLHPDESNASYLAKVMFRRGGTLGTAGMSVHVRLGTCAVSTVAVLVPALVGPLVPHVPRHRSLSTQFQRPHFQDMSATCVEIQTPMTSSSSWAHSYRSMVSRLCLLSSALDHRPSRISHRRFGRFLILRCTRDYYHCMELASVLGAVALQLHEVRSVSRGAVHVSIGAGWWLAAWQPQP